MASYDFMDELLKKSRDAQERVKKGSAEIPKIAEKKSEDLLRVDDNDRPINVKMVTIRSDPNDDKGLYSGKGHQTSPYDPCDRCSFPRGKLPGAYQVQVKAPLKTRIVCLACMAYFRNKGEERPEDKFGKNTEAIQFANQLNEAKKRKRSEGESTGKQES